MGKIVTATKRSNRTKFYSEVEKHTSLPLAKRRPLAIGRGGEKVAPRKFHLGDDEIEALTAEYKETKTFPNPHNKGSYHYIVAALVGLGINEVHSRPVVFKRIEKLMSDDSTIEGEGKEATTAWDRFKSKDPRNAETGQDWEGRLDTNIVVLQRLWSSKDQNEYSLTPYGLKILQVGQKIMGHKGGVIDVLVGDKGGISYRLNTKSDRPINETKERGMGSPAALKAAKAAKRDEAKAAKQKADKKAARVAAKSEPKTEETATPVAAE